MYYIVLYKYTHQAINQCSDWTLKLSAQLYLELYIEDKFWIKRTQVLSDWDFLLWP